MKNIIPRTLAERGNLLYYSFMAMTVGELKEILEDLDNDMLVVLSSDGEGNGYSPLSGWTPTMYVEENSWSGETYSDEDVDDANESNDVSPGDDDFMVYEENAVILWPTN